MVSAVVLCAGSSHRMGTPKCLLKIGGETFLQHIVDVLHQAQILDIVVVLGAGADEINSTLHWFNGKIVINTDSQKGQLSSIIVGLNELDLPDVHGAMICPVDHPLISSALIIDLLQAFWKSKKSIVIPTFRGQRGHPVIFASTLFDELRNAPLDIGARGVVHNHSNDIFEMVTEEEGVIVNIDTPEEYETKIRQRVL